MQRIWWGNFELEVGKSWQRKIGPLWLAVKRLAQEWQIFYTEDTNWDDDRWKIVTESAAMPKMELENLQNRYITNDQTGKFAILPSLADRPVVTRPIKPMFIPQRCDVVLYVSTPLWVKGNLSGTDIVFKDFPIVRPSDTWFGENTILGEICYASSTSARLRLEDVPKRQHRAITPLLIRNESESLLPLERINLPVPYLSLYEDKDKLLWTEPVQMIRKSDKQTALIKIFPGPPSQADNANLITEAREKIVEKSITRTISSLFA